MKKVDQIVKDNKIGISEGFDVLFGFDMETDIGSYTPYYTGVQYGTEQILKILDKYGISSTFYWTGHAAENNPEQLLEVDQAGHETGCHGLFHETLGDAIFPLPNNWPILESEVKGRLTIATEIIKEISGKRPVGFRCPRLWGSTKVINVLEELGYTSDASLPLYYYGKPIIPYHPSSDDWTIPGEMNILEIPNFCDLTMDSADEYQRDRDQWPLFRTKSASALMDKVIGFVDYVNKQGHRPVLCFYFHPWEFHSMPQAALNFGECYVKPLPFIVENCGPKAIEEFDILCDSLIQAGGEFVRADELVEQYNFSN